MRDGRLVVPLLSMLFLFISGCSSCGWNMFIHWLVNGSLPLTDARSIWIWSTICLLYDCLSLHNTRTPPLIMQFSWTVTISTSRKMLEIIVNHWWNVLVFSELKVIFRFLYCQTAIIVTVKASCGQGVWVCVCVCLCECALVLVYPFTDKCKNMEWFPEEDEEDLMFSPALLARRASESWIIEKPVPEVIHYK